MYWELKTDKGTIAWNPDDPFHFELFKNGEKVHCEGIEIYLHPDEDNPDVCSDPSILIDTPSEEI